MGKSQHIDLGVYLKFPIEGTGRNLYSYDISINYLNIFSGSLFTFIFYPLLWGAFEIIRRFMKVSGNA